LIVTSHAKNEIRLRCCGLAMIGALRFPILYAQITLGKAPDDDLSRDKKFGKKLTASTRKP
jgi:hypothetical protein